MHVLVLGGAGMLGHKMVPTLARRGLRVTCTVRGATLASTGIPFAEANVIPGVNAENLEAVEDLVVKTRAEVIVNCIGIVKQRPAAQAAIPSITVNALLPHRLAAAAASYGGRLVHFSTDCVFDGKRGRYTEADLTNAEDLYGRTKGLGEVRAENALTLRTSIIGRELTNKVSLLEWFLSQEGKTVRGFTRHQWSGVTTTRLSNLVADILERRPGASGLYNVASAPISKFDLLRLIRDAYDLNVEIIPDDSTFCDRSLIGKAFDGLMGQSPPPWPAQIAEMRDDPTPHSNRTNT